MVNSLKLKYILLISCTINVGYVGFSFFSSSKEKTEKPAEEEDKTGPTITEKNTASFIFKFLNFLAERKKTQETQETGNRSFIGQIIDVLKQKIEDQERKKFKEEKIAFKEEKIALKLKTLEERMKDLIRLLKTQYVPNKVIELLLINKNSYMKDLKQAADKSLVEGIKVEDKSLVEGIITELKELIVKLKRELKDDEISKDDEILKDDEIIDIAVQKIVDLIIQIQTDMASKFIFEFDTQFKYKNQKSSLKLIREKMDYLKEHGTHMEKIKFSIDTRTLDALGQEEMNLIESKVRELIEEIIYIIESLIKNETMLNKFSNIKINKIFIKIISLIGLSKAKQVNFAIKQQKPKRETEEKENNTPEEKSRQENIFIDDLKDIIEDILTKSNNISDELIFIILKKVMDIIEQQLIENTYTKDNIINKIGMLRGLAQKLMELNVENKILDNILQVATDKTAQKAIDMIQILKEKRVSDDQIYQTIGLISSSTQLTNASGLLNQVYWGLDLIDILFLKKI